MSVRVTDTQDYSSFANFQSTKRQSAHVRELTQAIFRAIVEIKEAADACSVNSPHALIVSRGRAAPYAVVQKYFYYRSRERDPSSRGRGEQRPNRIRLERRKGREEGSAFYRRASDDITR